ncbi:MAG: Sec-independent protein translocase protein TatB [Pseudomonadota bacterium]
MAELGGSELFLLLALGLIVLGPKRLPEIASKIGGWVGKARRLARSMQRQLEDELRDDVNAIKAPLSELKGGLETDFKKATEAPDPADPAYDIDEPAHHIPSDDDEYSELHEAEKAEAERTAANDKS